MTEEDSLPGWVCVCKDSDCTLAQEVLTNSGIHSEVVAMDSLGKHSNDSLWVRDEDYDRAVALIEKMTHEFFNPPAGAWLCRCGEQIEAQFDICWKCGKDKPTHA